MRGKQGNVLVFVLLGAVLISASAVAGYFYKAVRQQEPSTQQNPQEPKTNEMSSYTYRLAFKELVVVLDRMGSGKIDGTFWQWPVKIVGQKVSPNIPHDLLNGAYLFYVQPEDMFYDLQPGGYSTLSLISDRALAGRIINSKEKGKETTCVPKDFPLGTIQTRAIRCTTTYTNPDDLRQVDQSFTNNCYLSLGNNKYLAYEQKLKPIGDVDLCQKLTDMGVQGVKVDLVAKSPVSLELNWFRLERVRTLQSALELYFIDNNHYPNQLGELVPKYLARFPETTGYASGLDQEMTFKTGNDGRDYQICTIFGAEVKVSNTITKIGKNCFNRPAP